MSEVQDEGAVLELVDEDDPRDETVLDAKKADEEEVEEKPAVVQPVLDYPKPAVGGRAPAWAKVPAGLKIPRGTTVYFILFLAEWTSTPHKGDRQCIVWSNTLADDLLAIERAKAHESQSRLNHEMAKQMVRAIDGHKTNWDGLPGPGSIDVFWREIGPKCRGQLQRLWMQLHSFSQEEQRRFFESCIAAVATG